MSNLSMLVVYQYIKGVCFSILQSLPISSLQTEVETSHLPRASLPPPLPF